MITVGELAAKLAAMPQDAPVVVDTDVGFQNVDRVELSMAAKATKDAPTCAEWIEPEGYCYEGGTEDGTLQNVVAIY